MMRWTGGEEQVTEALAILMILAALVVIGSYALAIADKSPAATPRAIIRAIAAH